MTTRYTWRDAFTDDELDALHAEGFGHPRQSVGWRARVERHSLGWVCARPLADGPLTAGPLADGPLAAGPLTVTPLTDGQTAATPLTGFVNVAWDGGAHAFLLDTVVATAARHTGVGTGLVAAAADGARAAGCEWLHVDFEPHLRAFYLDACGFRSTDAGLLRL
ncbi:GNAT family N-acetyltransferase [Streptomyces sp. CB01881]|uniref:GNAT family N-acetyltransferase n=1 Tax=Streptomyces sp. CB01881 TaxID=2078691 RepID=UPI000CDBF501|nr:GNAT family N-acetyltransferase [Streptomyces sp. CB01881]AUY53293.1 GNAT family N-acetyltransferase [Streptomyces sp. CB01881]TYC69450.1 GNAT family N-acetyltransferase [Streptomyces sp. CB01881]